MATNLHQVKRGYADLKRSGTQMYYERMGHGDPVILIHQCWWNNFEFEGVIPMLAKEYTIHSPDSLGFGFSQRPSGLNSPTLPTASLILWMRLA